MPKTTSNHVRLNAIQYHNLHLHCPGALIYDNLLHELKDVVAVLG